MSVQTPIHHFGVLLLVLVSFSACNDTSWDAPGPRESFELFLLDLFKGESEKAFEKIDPDDRKTLIAGRKGLEGLSEEQMPADHEMLVIAGFDNPYDIKKMSLDTPLETKPKAGETVDITLHYRDGRSGKVRMKWGGTQWFVDLPLEENAEGSNG